jgi:hypothetical protein
VLEVDARQAWRQAFNAGRPDEWKQLIQRWWDEYEPHHADEIIRRDENS